MSGSEEHPRTTGSDAGQPSESVTPAARVFANYVLIPTRRLPDGHTRSSGLHGAGLLVFSDETIQQVELRTGDAADIVGQSVVPRTIAREDADNKIVGGHDDSSQKEVNAMTAQVACSACSAMFEVGPTHCPSCGLQLTAQAIPVVIARRYRIPTWAIICGAIVLFFAIAAIVDKIQQDPGGQKAALRSDINFGRLNVPAILERHCGQPISTTQTASGTEMHYRTNIADYYATLGAGGPRFEQARGDTRSALSPDAAMELLNCK